jgi:pheromone shutdown protein TraB
MAAAKLATISLGGCHLTILPTVKGLTREKRKVRETVEAIGPDLIALPVSREGLQGLGAIHRGKQPEIFLSHYEQIYALKLARFGKVAVPPPSYTEAFAAASEKGIPVKAIDLSEDDFADAFCDDVSTTNLVYHSIRWRWLRRKSFRKATNARQFVLAWDRAVNSLKGFRNLEGRREEHMARRLLDLSKRYKNILAILELERMEGVVRRLESGGSAPLGKEKGGSAQKGEEE